MTTNKVLLAAMTTALALNACTSPKDSSAGAAASPTPTSSPRTYGHATVFSTVGRAAGNTNTNDTSEHPNITDDTTTRNNGDDGSRGGDDSLHGGGDGSHGSNDGSHGGDGFGGHGTGGEGG